ncbi:MAG: lasso peptide biosynthesis B2 protein [Acidobacteria bacterium]|nr:lasso peptide biosynthesis B2 protein [Acidobacteriota bacterium]MCA1643529.1 lasso peptide biosynthesis B2 protein [Acidobacteriota bacterium]
MPNVIGLARRALRFAAGKPRETLLLAGMARDVLALSLLVRLLPLPRALAILEPRPRARTETPAGVSDERVVQLLDALLGIDALCFAPICWKRAAVLHRRLTLRGRETRIVFGVRRAGEDTLAGHAWLEAGGVPLYEVETPEYSVTYCFPS